MLNRKTCKHTQTEFLTHPFFPSKEVCKDCGKAMYDQSKWTGNTNLEEFYEMIEEEE